MTTKITSAAAVLGKLGGSVKSEAKAISSRENGKRGGRPRMAYQIVDGFNGHRSSGHRTLKAAGAALASAKARFYQRNPNADCWLQIVPGSAEWSAERREWSETISDDDREYLDGIE